MVWSVYQREGQWQRENAERGARNASGQALTDPGQYRRGRDAVPGAAGVEELFGDGSDVIAHVPPVSGLASNAPTSAIGRQTPLRMHPVEPNRDGAGLGW